MQFRNNNFEKKVLASFAIALVNSAAAGDMSYPGDLCCTLYRDNDFEGSQLKLCLDTDTYGFNGQQQWILRDFNVNSSDDTWENRLSSYWCGKNVEYDFCHNYYGTCDGKKGMSGAGNVKNPKIGYNDHADRLKMRYYDATERGAVTLFKDKDCKYDTGRFYADAEATQIASYTRDQMEANNMREKYPSSVMIPYGYSVTLWTDDRFTGTPAYFIGYEWIHGKEEMQCINLEDYDYNDKTKSLQVYRTNQGRKARGYWQAITSSGGSTFTYTERAIYASTPGKEVQNYSLNLDMNSGFEFVGFFGDETTISDEYAHQIITDTKLQVSKDTGKTRQVSCNDKHSWQGVGLWQFVVQSGDESISILTEHTACRYGRLYNVAPDCPWNACMNSECSVCGGDWEM